MALRQELKSLASQHQSVKEEGKKLVQIQQVCQKEFRRLDKQQRNQGEKVQQASNQLDEIEFNAQKDLKVRGQAQRIEAVLIQAQQKLDESKAKNAKLEKIATKYNVDTQRLKEYFYGKAGNPQMQEAEA